LDTHKRTFLKTVSWRVLASFTTTGVTFVLTGRLDLAISVGVADSVVKFFIYYLHERMWSRSRYGQIRKPEYEI
jgi:adenylylsulfate kinase